MPSSRWLAVALVAVVGLAGCAAPGREGDAGAAAAWPRCEHPWPCGDGTEWPPGLEGPFERLEPQAVRVRSFDGVELDGAVWLPKLPEGVRAPVVLKSTPYLGTCSYQSIMRRAPSCSGSPGSPARMEGDNFAELVEAGYAVGIFSVRGTGASGGCYDLWGADEQRDQAVLVEWAAAQPWSNGRVAMTGLSYAGTTPWEAAIQSPRALKAILVGGIVTDPYLSIATPQGAIENGYDRFQAGTTAANSLQPPWNGGADQLLRYAPGARERACGDVAATLAGNVVTARADERPQAWFDERRLADRFEHVTAAVLLAHGFLDDDFHRYQEDTVWPRLAQAPKWFVLGQWGHTYAFEREMAGFGHAASWLDLQRAWLDFWLKGLGEPPRMGVVDYQDSSLAWRASAAWPPEDAREEVLYLAGDALATAPGNGARGFVAAPHDVPSDVRPDTYCPSASPVAPSVAFTSAPVERATVVAGNAFALLEVASDQAGGTFSVDLLRVPAGFACGGGDDPEVVTRGGVDLRFHEGDFSARPFPVGTRTPVRVDLHNLALHLEPGDRVALVVRNPHDRDTREFAPTITVHGASHVVLPLVDGTFGGSAPTLAYPPRPFVP